MEAAGIQIDKLSKHVERARTRKPQGSSMHRVEESGAEAVRRYADLEGLRRGKRSVGRGMQRAVEGDAACRMQNTAWMPWSMPI